MSATDLKHWSEVARREPRNSWLLRAELASYFIRPGDVVCDLGAGAQTIERLLPPGVGYVPVDCVREHENTYVVDFNKGFSLPDKPFNVILCLGLLKYIHDLPAFFGSLSSTQPGNFIIFTCGYDKRLSGTHANKHPFNTQEDMLRFFSQYVDGLAVISRIGRPNSRRRAVMLCGVLGKGTAPVALVERHSLLEIVSSYISPAELAPVWLRRTKRRIDEYLTAIVKLSWTKLRRLNSQRLHEC